MGTSSLKKQIKAAKSKVFRRLLIKRRQADGTYETSWQDISKDVKKWGKITTAVDIAKQATFRFNPLTVVLANDEGTYNPDDDNASLWFGYSSQQRTLVRIEAGYLHQTLGASGIWTNTEHPSGEAQWDEDDWDVPITYWDSVAGLDVVFNGFISGDLNVSDKSSINMKIKPLTGVFQDFAAANLNFIVSGGVTASAFMTKLRDMTDGSSNFFFRPFFGDTTANWIINTTTVNYGNLNTTGAKHVRDKSVWDVIQRLSEAENFTTYVNRLGQFVFKQATVDSDTSFHFFGAGLKDNIWGHTIKKIDSYAPKITDFYSRVEVKHLDADTSTSFSVQQAAVTIDGGGAAWTLGQRVLKIDNTWIPNSATANNIASTIFTEASSAKKQVVFNTNFIPHLEPLNLIKITYDSTAFKTDSLWDLNNWASASSRELIWDSSEGNALSFNSKEFKVVSVSHDLDKFETKIIAKES